MSTQETILVIVEPSHDKHEALERAVITSKLRENPPKLHLFICVDEDNTDLKARNQNLYRDASWLKGLVTELDESGLEYDYELCWSTEWANAVLNCADRVQPGRIFLPDYDPAVRRNMFTNSKWELLRKSFSPVMIVRPGASSHRKVILAAINIQAENSKYIEMNEKIMTQSRVLAELYGAELYVVNAYKDSDHYPDREKLLKFTGLPTDHVHLGEGDPADAVAAYAEEIKADIVVIGTMHRTGAAALMRGNTSEKVLRRVQQDVLTLS